MARTSPRARTNRAPEPSMGLTAATADVIDIIRGRPACGSDGPGDCDRMTAMIAENDNLLK